MITGRRRPVLVRFESFTTTDGQYGETKGWALHTLAWVNMEPDRGREQHKAGELESVVSHTVRGDYYDLKDVTPQMRMLYSPGMEYGDSPPTIPSTANVFNVLAVMPAVNDLSDVVIKVEQEGRAYGSL